MKGHVKSNHIPHARGVHKTSF